MRPVVSGRLQIRFIFWTAWPAAPFIRLSMALVMIAAFCVGNMKTTYTPGLTLRAEALSERNLDPPVTLARGDELGAFLLGSTVVTVWSKGSVKLDKHIASGTVAMGHRIGAVCS